MNIFILIGCGIIVGVCIGFLFGAVPAPAATFGSRPDRAVWKPHSNSGNDDDIEAFKAAARKLNISIKVGYPVPGDNSDVCAGLGIKGIYILRKQADRADELQTEKWEQDKAMRA